MPASFDDFAGLQSKVWHGSLALEIRLAPSDCRTYDDSDPYLVQYPRLSYLAFLLPRIHRFLVPNLIDPDVSPHDAWLSFEGVPLKWHYPLGLLYDLLAGATPFTSDAVSSAGRALPLAASQVIAAVADSSENESQRPLPWRLTIHYSKFPADHLLQLDAAGRTMHDTYINAVKEADFIRNGNARAVMSLSKSDSDDLWLAVQNHDLLLFNTINTKLLNPPGVDLRHVPMRFYLPTSSTAPTAAATTVKPLPSTSPPLSTTPNSTPATLPSSIPEDTPITATGHMRVVQSLIPLLVPGSRTPQTLGTALNTLLPAIFPSRRSPIYAQPVLHGAAVPLAARIEELARAAAYPDGFLHVAIVMHS